MKPLSIGVLVSGRGSNLEAILRAQKAGEMKSRVACVISNVAGVRALEIAKAYGVPATHLSHKDYADRAAFDAAMVEHLRRAGVDFVVLAGFMRIVTSTLLDAFPERVINIHPSLLPAFPGKDSAKQAIDHGVRVSGTTVHIVDGGMDTGPILFQAPVPVLDGDSADSLAARILPEEHRILIQAIRAFEEERVILSGDFPARRVQILLGSNA